MKLFVSFACHITMKTDQHTTHIIKKSYSSDGAGSRVYKRDTDVISVSGKPEHGYVIDIFLGEQIHWTPCNPCFEMSDL